MSQVLRQLGESTPGRSAGHTLEPALTRSGSELPDGDAAFWLVISGSSKVIVDTLDIVLTEIVAQLDFDENQGSSAGVSHSM